MTLKYLYILTLEINLMTLCMECYNFQWLHLMDIKLLIFKVLTVTEIYHHEKLNITLRNKYDTNLDASFAFDGVENLCTINCMLIYGTKTRKNPPMRYDHMLARTNGLASILKNTNFARRDNSLLFLAQLIIVLI